ncbi:hypothetical protein L3Q82_022807, partial [Scortum barcoo]
HLSYLVFLPWQTTHLPTSSTPLGVHSTTSEDFRKMQRTLETLSEKVEQLQLEMQRKQRDTPHGSSDYRSRQRSLSPDSGRGRSHYYPPDRNIYRDSSYERLATRDNSSGPSRHERDRYDRWDSYGPPGSSERHTRGYSPPPRDYTHRGRSPQHHGDRHSSYRSPSPGRVRFQSPSHTGSNKKLDVTHDPTGRRGRWALELDPYQWTLIESLYHTTELPCSPYKQRDHFSLCAQISLSFHSPHMDTNTFLNMEFQEELFSDQGRQYESEIIQTICQRLHIKKKRTTPYHPRGNGMVERFNRTLKEQLAKLIHQHGGEWDDYLSAVVLAFNSTPHSTTGYSPYFLAHGREACLPASVHLSTPVVLQTPQNYGSELVRRLDTVFQAVRSHSEDQRLKREYYFNQHVKFRPYECGDLVWMDDPTTQRKKLDPNWTGPYEVLSSDDKGLLYTLLDLRHPQAEPRVIHYDRLKPYRSSWDLSSAPANRPLPMNTLPRFSDFLLFHSDFKISKTLQSQAIVRQIDRNPADRYSTVGDGIVFACVSSSLRGY